MKKFFSFTMIAAVALFLAGCNGYDDSDLQRRVKALEDNYLSLNNSVNTMSQTVNALDAGDVITGVAPINDGGKVVGYTVTFKKSGSITIMNGNDGAPGSTPNVSAVKDSDGKYYWKVDGEWLKDGSGNKIPAAGSDGVTPQFKIEDGFWYVNAGAGWSKLGQATGEKGDSFFRSVTETADSVVITLADGTVYELPKEKQFKFSIASNYWPIFDNLNQFVNNIYDLNFTIEGAEGDVNLVVLSKTDETKTAVNWNENKKGGYIRITHNYESYTSDDSLNLNRGEDVLTIIVSDDAGHSAIKTFYVPYSNLELMYYNDYNEDGYVDFFFNNQAAEEDIYVTLAVVFDHQFGDYNAGETFQISESQFRDYFKLQFGGSSGSFATLTYDGNYSARHSLSSDISYYYVSCDYHYNIPKNTTGNDRTTYFQVEFKLPPAPGTTNFRRYSYSFPVHQYK